MFAPSFKIEVTFAATALPFFAIPGPGPGRLPSALVDDARLRHRDDDDAHTHTHAQTDTYYECYLEGVPKHTEYRDGRHADTNRRTHTSILTNISRECHHTPNKRDIHKRPPCTHTNILNDILKERQHTHRIGEIPEYTNNSPAHRHLTHIS